MKSNKFELGRRLRRLLQLRIASIKQIFRLKFFFGCLFPFAFHMTTIDMATISPQPDSPVWKMPHTWEVSFHTAREESEGNEELFLQSIVRESKKHFFPTDRSHEMWSISMTKYRLSLLYFIPFPLKCLTYIARFSKRQRMKNSKQWFVNYVVPVMAFSGFYEVENSCRFVKLRRNLLETFYVQLTILCIINFLGTSISY